MSEVKTIYKFDCDLKLRVITSIPIKATKVGFNTYCVEGHTVSQRRIDTLTPYKLKDHLIGYSFDSRNIVKFEKKCEEKLKNGKES